MCSTSRWRPPVPVSRPACLSHENGGRQPGRCPPSWPGRAVGTRGHVHTGCLEGPLDKGLGSVLLLPVASLPPSPVHPLPRKITPVSSPSPTPSPASEATGWDHPVGRTGWGPVSVSRASHCEGIPSAPDIVKSRAGISAGVATAPKEGLPPEPITSPSSAPSQAPGAAEKGVTPLFIHSFIHSIMHSFNKCYGGSPTRRGGGRQSPLKGSWRINSKVLGAPGRAWLRGHSH